MRRPDANRYDPSPTHVRGLVDASGLSQRECARRIGVSERIMRYWISGESEIPYAAQYCLEALRGKTTV